MKISQKRTCTGCAASYVERCSSVCELGYEVGPKRVPLRKGHPLLKKGETHIMEQCPMEPCPKPLTISQCLKAPRKSL